MSQVGSELLKSSRVRPNCTHYCETYESIIQTLRRQMERKGCTLSPQQVYWLLGLIHFTSISAEITRHFRFCKSDRKHIAISNRYMRLGTPAPQTMYFVYISLYTKWGFWVPIPSWSVAQPALLPPQFTSRLARFMKCPGAREMLPRLILCDRITTVSVCRNRNWYRRGRIDLPEKGEREGEAEGGESEGKEVEGEGGVTEWEVCEEMRISLHSGPQARAARLIEVNGND